MFPWSVIPMAGISRRCASASMGVIFAAPSSMEYSVWLCRCTKKDPADVPVHRPVSLGPRTDSFGVSRHVSRVILMFARKPPPLRSVGTDPRLPVHPGQRTDLSGLVADGSGAAGRRGGPGQPGPRFRSASVPDRDHRAAAGAVVDRHRRGIRPVGWRRAGNAREAAVADRSTSPGSSSPGGRPSSSCSGSAGLPRRVRS